MIKQNNNPNYLRTLLKYDLITLKQFYFRQKSNKLNINTFKLTDTE
jgi:hypothetical protein